MGVSAGYYADKMARMTNAQCISAARSKMYTMFPGGKTASGVKLLATFIKRWNVDRFAYGSYSFGRVGMSEDAWNKMAAPEGRLLWAGEHTHPQYRGSVHGAYLTGLREANRVLATAST